MRAKGTGLAGVFGWLRSLTGGSPAGNAETVTGDVPAAGGRPAGPEPPWAQAALHSSHGMAIIDPASATLRAVNPAYAQLVGRTPGQLEGQSSNAVYPAS
ncbi:MAG TPA: PAS domain-containing protein, partial [Steroidobacteraceae bacterium]|nr:PAS domain-containing protein [Steroidobacteraceae bacterium]